MTVRSRLPALLAEGLNDVQIAERLGVAPHRVGVVRRSMGLSPASLVKANNRPTDELIAQIKQRAAEGWPPGEISKTLGVSMDSVRRWGDAVQNGRDWNKLCRWASRHQRKLYEELMA